MQTQTYANSEPDINLWIREAKASEQAQNCGMFLLHTGVVRSTPKQAVRQGISGLPNVIALELSYNKQALEEALHDAYSYDGVYYARAWVNEGRLSVGDTMMYVLVGADIRPRCVPALEKLVERIKTEIVVEKEIFA